MKESKFPIIIFIILILLLILCSTLLLLKGGLNFNINFKPESKVSAIKLSVDGKDVAILGSEEDLEWINNTLLEKYIDKEITYESRYIVENLAFKIIKVKEEEIQDKKDVLNYIVDNNIISVKMTYVIERYEIIPRETTIVESSKYNKGEMFVSDTGCDGSRYIKEKIILINGVEVEKIILQSIIANAPQNRVEVYGTKE